MPYGSQRPDGGSMRIVETTIADNIEQVSKLLTSTSKVADGWDKTAKANGTPDFGTTIKSKWSSMWGNS